jgi:hypothetical protein
MTKQEAILFLTNNQPLSSDVELSNNISVIERYDKVRIFFIENPDEVCIPLFLNSFGGNNGLGVYQLIEDVIVKFSANIVVPHLYQSLQSKNYFVRYWSSQMVTLFPDLSLINPVSLLLKEQEYDIKSSAIFALKCIGGEIIATILEIYEGNETDEELKELAKQSITEVRSIPLK